MMTLQDKYQEEWSDKGVVYLKNKHNRGIYHISQRMGKIKVSILTIKKLFRKTNPKILISYPDDPIKDSWITDFIKWGYTNQNITFVNTSSLKKYVDQKFDLYIIDECFTGETEILTSNGFVRFDKLTSDAIIGQWDNNTISFVKPSRFIKKEYNGKLINFKIKDNIKVPITPNHNHCFLNKNNQLFTRKIKDLKNTAKYGKKGNSVLSPNYFTILSGKSDIIDNKTLSPLEQMYIILQADGSIHQVNKNCITCAFSFTKSRKKERFLNILLNSKLPFIKSNDNNGDKERWIVEFPLNASKMLDDHFEYPMSYEKANLIIEEMIHWDGSIISDKLYYYSSIIKKNVDFYNKVATIAGHSCYISIQKDNRKDTYNDVYRLSIQKNTHLKPMTYFNVNEEYNYNGLVYCVTVPSSKIVLRHNGYTFISGNCHRLSEGQLESCSSICNNSDYSLGLSGTINNDSKSLLKSVLKMNTIVEYDTEQAIKDGILANYQITVHLTPLDNKLLSFKNSKGKMISEKTRFDNITWVIDNNLTGKAKMLKIFERTRLLNGSIAKFNKTKELLHILEDKRLLLFTGLQKAAESYDIPYHHSGCKNTNLEDFKSNKIHKLALAEQGKIGVTYKNLDSIILTAFTGNDEMMSQVISRAILMDYGDKIADIHIICSTEEIELKKLKLALSMLDKSKIKYI